MDRGGGPAGGGRRGRYRRAAAWTVVVVAVLVTEVAVLGDRISADLARLTGGAPGPADAPAAARTPTPPAEPAASGLVSGVDLRPLDACAPATTCPVRLQVRLTGPGVTDVVWRTRTEDLCTGARHESGERHLAVPPGDRVDLVTDVAVPPGAAVAVSPVVTAPAVVAGPPVVLPARPQCAPAGSGR